MQGLNACMAYGALPCHQTTTADAITAYVQAYLKSNYQTWIEVMVETKVRTSRCATSPCTVRAPGSWGAVGTALESCAEVYAGAHHS